MDKDKKVKILKLVNSIISESYHRGTFAHIAHKYPDDFENYGKNIDELYSKISSLLDKELK